MSRVAKAGFDRAFIGPAVLPDWWADALERDLSVLPEIEFRIARFLDVPVEVVRDPTRPLQAPAYPDARLRKVKNIEVDRLTAAIHAALRVGAAVARSLRQPAPETRPPPRDPKEWVTGAFGADAPDLDRLVEDLWRRGIPVIPLEYLPKPRFQGLSGIVAGRPVIVVGYGGDEPPRVAHYVAHEAAHIVLGHCSENEPVIDAGDEDEDGGNIEDEADDYARMLMTRGKEIPRPPRGDPREVAEKAHEVGVALGLDGGIVAWHWAVRVGDFQSGSLVLRALYRSTGAHRILRKRFDEHVDLDGANEGDRALLRCVFGDPDRDAAFAS